MRSLDAELEEMGVPASEPPLPPVREVAKPPHAHWERCKGWIEAGLEDTLFKISDIEEQLAKGDAVLWPGSKCALVTEFVTYPNGERLSQVMSAGGDLEEIDSMVPGMEAYARLNGCSRSTIVGRRGWERVMKKRGYSFLSVTLTKVL
jgi:hypothetical protein